MPCFQAIATGVYSSITGEFISILNKGKGCMHLREHSTRVCLEHSKRVINWKSRNDTTDKRREKIT